MLDESLLIQNVVKCFPDLINAWCEVKAKELKLPKDRMCGEAVKTFSSYFSESYIRDNISQKYKLKFRVDNGKQKGLSKIERLRIQLSKIESEIQHNLYETTVYENK